MLGKRDDVALASFVRAPLEAGAHALDLNAGIDGRSDPLLDAASRVRVVAPNTPLFLDTGDPTALAHVIARAPAPVVANAVVLGDGSEPALLDAIAHAGAGAVLSPRGYDGGDALSAGALVDQLLRGVERARAAGVHGPLYLDALGYPPAIDRGRWRRSVEVARAMPDVNAALLLAIGNVGHGAPPRLRPWLRLVTLALAVGAGARALILPVLERPLIEAVHLIEGSRTAAGNLDEWLLAVAPGEGDTPNPPPASAPRALLEAWGLLPRMTPGDA